MKQWTVYFRDKNGSKASVVIEAEDRVGVFAELKKRGISPISVTEGASNKKPRKVARGGAPSKGRGLIAAAIVILGVGAAVWYLMPGGEKKPVVVKKNVKVAKIAQVDVQKRPKSEPKSTSIRKTKKPEKPLRYWERPNTNGMTEAQIRKWKFKRLPPPAYTNNAMLLRPKPKFEIFGTRAENEIAMLLTIQPGESLVGSPQYDESFRQEFIESCKTPIIIKEDDTEYEKQLKRDMEEVKIELHNRMLKGEDICKIMAETRLESMRLGMIRQQVEDETRTMLFEAKSPDDLDIAVEAANKLLEEKGIAPIKLSPMLKRSLLRKMGN